VTRRSAGHGPLRDAGVEGDGLIVPDAVAAVVARLLRLERGDAEGTDDAEGGIGAESNLPAMPRARVPTRAGGWVVVHATRLSGTGATTRDHGTVEPSQIAVVLEPARRHELMPLVLEAYELTPRESEVTALVLLGHPTKRIGEELGISPLTVQQHLKGVFDKVGVRSKRELAATIFSTHYWPRVASAAPIAANGQFGPEERS
jgi:DNA-binding CsgD family transcriptional regulator